MKAVHRRWQARAIRLRPEEYRRLWASIRAGFVIGRDGRPKRIDHPGYGATDAFYEGIGHANALNTCNVWTTDRLRIAGIRTSLWNPFANCPNLREGQFQCGSCSLCLRT